MKLNEEEKKVFEDFLSFLQLHPELKKVGVYLGAGAISLRS